MIDQAEKLRKIMELNNMEKVDSNDKNSAKVISISSGKGGVGKTSFAVNFSISLKRLGYEVVIIDADIGLSNVEIITGISLKHDISEIVYSNMNILDIMGTGPEGIKIISGGSGLKELKLLSNNNISRLINEIEKLQSMVDYIIIDTGAGISNSVIDFIMASKEVIIICTPDPTSLMDSYILVKTLMFSKYSGSINIVSNQVINRKEGKEIFEKIDNVTNNFLKVKLNYLGHIEKNKLFSDSIREQIPFVVSHPTNTISKNINIMAMKFLDNELSILENKKTSFAGKLFDIFYKRGDWLDHQFKYLKIGMKIDIAKSDNKEVYPSQVLDIISTNEMLISGPLKKNDIILLHIDEIIKIFYNVENKGKYYFEARIISRKYSPIYTLTIKKITEINTIQLREYYRLPSSININKEIEIIKNNEVQVLNELCEAKDISGGGMRILSNYQHCIGDKIFCIFKINNSIIKIKCSILRIENIDSFNFKYSIGVSFDDISAEDRELIISFIFEQQRILRCKGLI